MVARKEDALRAAADELGPSALAVAANVGNEGAAETIVAAAHDAFGRARRDREQRGDNPYYGDLVGIDWPARRRP